uniref:hydroxyacylglutathione hydrolase n=1 Tax=Arcella intermedia TaxID=1963864 RepID=A0A6B2LF28_9EUKA
MKVHPIRVLGNSANYAYLIIDTKSNTAAAVDPAEPDTIIAEANKLNVNITTILTTHHHWDHANGNPGMVEKIPGLVVVGADDRIPCLNHKVGEGSELKLGDIQISVRFTPCHTSGHVYYIAKGPDSNTLALFSGDTLFIAGCGKFFEGTAEQMHHALMNVAAKLPGDTQVWCGHEYTVSNLRFALSVDPQNTILQEKYKWAQERVGSSLPTVPSTIEEELSYNPFMRVNLPALKTAVGDPTDSDITTMHKLREAKNNFK